MIENIGSHGDYNNVNEASAQQESSLDINIVINMKQIEPDFNFEEGFISKNEAASYEPKFKDEFNTLKKLSSARFSEKEFDRIVSRHLGLITGQEEGREFIG